MLMVIDRQPIDMPPGSSGKKHTRNSMHDERGGMMQGTSQSLTRDDGANEDSSPLQNAKTLKFNELDQQKKRGSLWAKEFLKYYTEGLYFTRARARAQTFGK